MPYPAYITSIAFIYFLISAKRHYSVLQLAHHYGIVTTSRLL